MAARAIPPHILRLINDNIRDAAVDFERRRSITESTIGGPQHWDFLCECGAHGCFETIVRLRLHEYEAVVAAGGWVLAPRHEPMRGLERASLNRVRRATRHPEEHPSS